MQFFKVILFLGVFAPSLLVAQEVAISGKDFESGAGDAKLAEIARQAAASGKTIVITTPPYWQDKAVAKLRAGSSTVHLKTTDAFFENVLVSVVASDAPVKPVEAPAKTTDTLHPAKPTAVAVVAKAQPVKAEPAKAIGTVAMTTTTAPAIVPPPSATPVPAPVQVASLAKPETNPTSPVAVAPPAPVQTATTPMENVAGVTVAEARMRLENQLSLGKSLDGTIKAEQLQKGDQIFVNGPARAVVRRVGAHTQLFWLEGPLNLERAEISRSDAGRYRVDDSIHNVPAPTLRAMHSQAEIFAAQIPAEKSSVRTDMERHFNDSKGITESLHASQLQYGDLFYVYRKYAVVFRRTDYSFDRYWLQGDIDLNQAGVVRDGDAYRVVSDRL